MLILTLICRQVQEFKTTLWKKAKCNFAGALNDRFTVQQLKHLYLRMINDPHWIHKYAERRRKKNSTNISFFKLLGKSAKEKEKKRFQNMQLGKKGNRKEGGRNFGVGKVKLSCCEFNWQKFYRIASDTQRRDIGMRKTRNDSLSSR